MTDQLLGEWASEPELLEELATAGSGEPSESTLYYGCLEDFVREFIVQLYRRRFGEHATYRWSAQW